MISLHHASCLDWLEEYEGPLFDSCVTDPPYHLTSIVKRFGGKNAAKAKVPEGGTGAYARASRGFMGKEWDGGDIAFRPETWRAIYDALKPGAHLVAFSGTRTYHRMACAIEDAGFEIRDQLQWLYGSGFPKSHNVSKGIDRINGDERPVVGTEALSNDIRSGKMASADACGRESRGLTRNVTAAASAASAAWEGWGTALKPACEPICLARKPLSEKSIAANVLTHGTGAINVDGCRIDAQGRPNREVALMRDDYEYGGQVLKGRADGSLQSSRAAGATDLGRWPANIVHDGSDEVLVGFPDAPGQLATVRGTEPSSPFTNVYGDMPNRAGSAEPRGDSGSAARFFYSAKAGPLDRIGTAHATVKPVDLMRWLCRLITPPGGHILEPFAGSGTTGIAAMAEGFGCTMIELEAEHVADIERKIAFLRGQGGASVIERHKAKIDRQASSLRDDGPLFAESSE